MDSKRKFISYSVGLGISLILLYKIAVYSQILAVLPLLAAWLFLIAVTEAFDRWYFGNNFWSRTRKEKFYLVLGTAVFCLILDFFGMFASRLWYYPPGTVLAYILLAPPAYYLYGKILFLFYESMEHYLEPEKRDINEILYTNLMNIELITGFLLLSGSFIYSLHLINMFEIPFLALNQPVALEAAWWYLPAYLLGFTFIFEYLSYREGDETLTMNLLGGNYLPLVSTMVASLVAILFVEVVNAPVDIWKFSSAAWPFGNLQILEIPLVAYLYWPLQIPPLLAFLRTIYPSEREIW